MVPSGHRLCVLCAAILVASCHLLPGVVSVAQDSQQRIGSEFVPGDALLTVVLEVAKTMQSPTMEMYPTEVADAWCQQNLGIPASAIDRIKLVVGAPGPGDPMFAVVISTRADFDARVISDDFLDTSRTVQVDGHVCFEVIPIPGVVLHARDARTAIVATRNYLDTVLRSAEASSTRGPLASMSSNVPHTGNLSALMAIEPIRPMAMGMLQVQADEIPPPLMPFTKIPQLLDALLVRVDIDRQEDGLTLVMLGRDEAAAGELLTVLTDGLEMGRQMGLFEATSQLPEDDPLADAMRQYAERISNKIVASLTPVQEGRRLTLSGSVTQGMATNGVLVGLLLPAVQASREAARRMTSSNNLKMIGLAVHNYYDTYRRLPSDIKAADGTPLLSWRVAILPFLEEMPLYEQFRKDEPWDSPHNLALLEKMPPVYDHPGVVVPPGTTVYQRPVGDGFIAGDQEPAGFPQITDGLSNTILAVEAPTHWFVDWTRPADLIMDRDQPVVSVLDPTRQGFQALFLDGSVRFISNEVDADLFSALLTFAGGEIVQP